MKWYSRLRIYKMSNVTFDPATMRAYSYNHWCFLAMVNGKLIFSSYSYSNSTSKHQSKVRSLLYKRGQEPDYYFEMPKGVLNPEAAITHYEFRINELEKQMAKKGTRKTTNAQRLVTIEIYESHIDQIREVYGLAKQFPEAMEAFETSLDASLQALGAA